MVRSFKALVSMGVYQEEQLAIWTELDTASDGSFTLHTGWNETFGTKEGQSFGMISGQRRRSASL
jgi:hypothetical protein